MESFWLRPVKGTLTVPSLARLIWEGPRLRLALFIGRALAWDAPWIPNVVGFGTLAALSGSLQAVPGIEAALTAPFMGSRVQEGPRLCLGLPLGRALGAPWIASWMRLGLLLGLLWGQEGAGADLKPGAFSSGSELSLTLSGSLLGCAV